MPDVNAALGRGLTVEHGGRSYELAPVDHLQVIGDFQTFLRARALEEVDTVGRLLGHVARDVAMRSYLDNASAGAYDFGSKFWLEAVQYPQGQKAILLACLRAKDRSVTKALAEEIYQAHGDAVRRLIWGDDAVDPEPDPGNAPAAPA